MQSRYFGARLQRMRRLNLKAFHVPIVAACRKTAFGGILGCGNYCLDVCRCIQVANPLAQGGFLIPPAYTNDSVSSYIKPIQYRWPTEGSLHSAHHVIAAFKAHRDEVNITRLIALIPKGTHRVVPCKRAEYSSRIC